MGSLLFSARGRLNRQRFWFTSIGFSIGLMVVGAVLAFAMSLLFPVQVDDSGAMHAEGAAAMPWVLFGIGYAVLSAWVGICLGVKRYHDLGKSGAWVLILLVPLIGPLVYLVQAGFLAGTPGPNQYGPDPLAAGIA